MACYHPIHAVVKGIKSNGKKDIEFLGDNRVLFDEIRIERKYGPAAKLIKIPCGNCIGCRLDYAKNWANRCMLESKKSPYNYFITLTYDDEHLPKNIQYDFKRNIKLGETNTLEKKDLQKFFKDLRYYYSLNYCLKDNPFKYYCCGEYGEKNARPHYHIILFNCQYFDDKIPFYKDSSGFTHYKSVKLEKLWKKGLCEICDFSWQTASYTARYVIKKHKGLDSDYYKKNHIEPEFTLMSRRPGIARDYYEQHKKDIYKYDSIIINSGTQNDNKSINCKPSRYFDKLYDIDEHEHFEKIRALRELKLSNKEKLLKTDLTPYEYLDICEEQKIKATSSLLRKEI